MQATRFTLLTATTLAVLSLGACASPGDTQGSNACPVGEERVCHTSPSDSRAIGSRIGGNRVCECETINTR